MAMKGRNLRGGRNPKRAQAIKDALAAALAGGSAGAGAGMAGSSGMTSSLRPRARPGSSGMTSSLRPKARPQDIGSTDSESTRGIDPRENYSKEDLMRLLASMAGGPAAMGLGAAKAGRAAAAAMGMNNGGVVKTKKKPKKGCVMKGRGGNFKGLK